MTGNKVKDTVHMTHDIIHRNDGIPFDAGLLDGIRVNKSAVERRAATIGTRRSVKKEYQAAWLLKAISCIDLTTLSGDDTPGNVLRLCAKARNPIRMDLMEALDIQGMGLTTGAVCVYHNLIPYAVEALKGTNIPVAAVSTGFPAGQIALSEKLREIKMSVAAGAKEIDIVISRALVLKSDWKGLYDEIKACREACGEAHMKTILATGEIPTLTKVAKASMVAMMAGSDFIKTSTGKESVNATLPVTLVMVRMIRQYQELTGYKVGYKPAGGISKAKDALNYLIMMKEELGNDWLRPELFRFGASSLLGDIERQLEHFVTGRYSASYRHPMA
ncbi:MAG: deoxyribose-phosphate aldolase [Saprospiraceae bacterium]|nr:MAG: deoxyribose-phosphate aldolase [Bacteroidetes bacterium OLB9]MCO6463972.1 deoxyribose-phosphate aldolase [Saprospiraceae bacterium]